MQTGEAAARLYDKAYHSERDARTRAAATRMLGEVFQWHEIRSVCDIGCGVGSWLRVAGELGATRLRGYDGPWVDPSALVVDRAVVTFTDLNVALAPVERYDLAISLEVAEHLTPERGPSLVADLCTLADLVLFSAAIPGQGGRGHVNERWQSYWAELFATHGHAPFDALRPLIWTNPEIPWWYRQNVLLYAREGSPAAAALADRAGPSPARLDMVHPEQMKTLERATLDRAVRQVVRMLLGRDRLGRAQ